jgi:hypothetical protein
LYVGSGRMPFYRVNAKLLQRSGKDRKDEPDNVVAGPAHCGTREGL